MDIKEKVAVFDNKEDVGRAAGRAIESAIVDLLKRKETIRMIFAAAPSQDTTLDYLSESKIIQWDRIIAFNMDEYIGLPNTAEQLFSTYLLKKLFSKVKFKEVCLIDPSKGVELEIDRISDLITNNEIDIVILGIGENGHIAFNDPPFADFEDSQVIKKVILDEVCRQQQVNDGCFSKIEEVPQEALTLTVPTILKGKQLFCIVLGNHKAEAVKETFLGGISTQWPSSILRTHDNCWFYFDKAAVSLLEI